jgi:hypothetical protein
LWDEASDTSSLGRRSFEPLSEDLERQLIEDIQESGGLASGFSLRDICNSKEDLYGAPGSSHCSKIQKKVDYWKDHPDRYYKRLQALGVKHVSAKKKKKQQQQHRPPRSPSP